MAYVQKTDRGSKLGQFAATAVQALSKIPGDIQDWKQKEADHKLRLQQAEQNQARLAQEMQARTIEMTDKAYTMQAGAQWNIAASDTPKESAKAWYQRVKQFAPFTGDTRDEKQYIEQTSNTAAIIGKDRAQRTIQAPALVSNVNITPEAHQKHYQQALADLQFASDYQDPKETAAMRSVLQKADQQYQNYRAALKLAETRAELRPEKESEFGKVQSREQAKGFAKALDTLPKVRQNIQNIDNALSIMDKSFTGPLAGKSYAFGLQKIAKDDAQELELYLSRENVLRVMEFAKEAGVRSIDTEQEQQRLMKSIANKEQSPKVLRKALLQMKAIQEEAVQLTLAKDAYVKQYGDLRGFVPGGQTNKTPELPSAALNILNKMGQKAK